MFFIPFFKNSEIFGKITWKHYFLDMNLHCCLLLEVCFPSLCLTNSYSFPKHTDMNYITKDNCPANPGLVVYLDVLYYYQLPPPKYLWPWYSCLCSSLYYPLDHKLYKKSHSLNSTKHCLSYSSYLKIYWKNERNMVFYAYFLAPVWYNV